MWDNAGMTLLLNLLPRYWHIVQKSQLWISMLQGGREVIEVKIHDQSYGAQNLDGKFMAFLNIISTWFYALANEVSWTNLIEGVHELSETSKFPIRGAKIVFESSMLIAL